LNQVVDFMPGLIARFFKLRYAERNLFFLTFTFTTLISLLIIIIPKRFILKRIGVVGFESSSNNSAENQRIAQGMAKAIRRTVRYTPWRITCFAKAISAKYLLKRSGVTSTLYLGVAKEGSNNLTAHAWLRCGSQIITGKEEMRRFTTVVFIT